MKLEIRSRGLRLNNDMRAHIEYELRFALAWFLRRIGDVAVHVSDRKNPRDGLRCRIVVRVPRFGRIVVTEKHPEFYALIDRAMQRVSHTVQRHFERRMARRLRHRRRRVATTAA